MVFGIFCWFSFHSFFVFYFCFVLLYVQAGYRLSRWSSARQSLCLFLLLFLSFRFFCILHICCFNLYWFAFCVMCVENLHFAFFLVSLFVFCPPCGKNKKQTQKVHLTKRRKEACSNRSLRPKATDINPPLFPSFLRSSFVPPISALPAPV